MANNENLTHFGPTFQSKVISSLLSDNQFIGQISDIIDSNYFESDSNKFLVKNIMEYFIEYKNVPTLEVLKIKTDEIVKRWPEYVKEVYRFGRPHHDIKNEWINE